jgi:hypothetical protein
MTEQNFIKTLQAVTIYREASTCPLNNSRKKDEVYLKDNDKLWCVTRKNEITPGK